jgi:hypothetical protein
VTLFGAAVPFTSGWKDLCTVFEWLADTFVACDTYDIEFLAADPSGDLAYTVGIERYAPAPPTGGS